MGRITRAISRLFSKSAEAATTTRPGWVAQALGGGPTASGVNVSPSSALACTAVLGCVRILAEDVSKLPIGVFKARSDGGSELAEGHPLHNLLQKPNAWQTRIDFFEQAMFAMVLRGNAYAVILRDERGRPSMLVPVSPDQVTVLVDPHDGQIFYQVARSSQHSMAVLRDQPLVIPAADMLHIRCLCAGGLLGMSVIQHAREAIGLALATEEHGARLFKNGAKPSGVLEHPQKLSDEAMARLKASWDSAYSGLGNTGKTIVLEEAMKYHSISMTSVDAEWLASRKFQVEEIARIFRVPLHMLQSLERATHSNIEHQARSYYDQTLMPYLERIEAALDDKFGLRDERMYVEFDTRALLRANIQARYSAYAVGRQWGWLSANDVLKEEGRNPIGPKGDIYMVPVNMQPAEMWGTDDKREDGDAV